MDELDSTHMNAPRLLLYFEGEDIKTAYLIVAKETVEIGGEGTSLLRCLSALLGSYYVFNISYPKVYNNFLVTLDVKLAGVPQLTNMPTLLATLFRKWRCA